MLGRADYEERRAARIERLRERAERLQSEGRLSIASAQRISAMIPFGQPILIGHHSEKRHRKDLERIHAKYDRGYEAINKSVELASRAASAERNDAISSDDPNARERLREKRAKLEKERDDAKTVNACTRKCKGDAARLAELLKAQGIEHSERVCKELLTPDFAGRVGYLPYRLTNLGAEIRRLTGRIEALEREAVRPEAPPQTFGDIALSEEDNRVQLRFPGKPGERCRHSLKARGFHWSPSTGAWQRQATPAARRVAEMVAMSWGSEWRT